MYRNFKVLNIQHSTLNIEHRIKTEFIRSWKFDVQCSMFKLFKVAALGRLILKVPFIDNFYDLSWETGWNRGVFEIPYVSCDDKIGLA